MEEIPHEKRSAEQILAKYGVLNFKQLNDFYTKEDQKLMKSHEWDHKNRELITNQIYEDIERTDATSLDEDSLEWFNEIKWFWNHHAISSALWRYCDPAAALEFAKHALENQSADHPNQITGLFSLLLSGRIKDAEELVKTIHPDEKDAADFLLRSYQNGWAEDI